MIPLLRSSCAAPLQTCSPCTAPLPCSSCVANHLQCSQSTVETCLPTVPTCALHPTTDGERSRWLATHREGAAHGECNRWFQQIGSAVENTYRFICYFVSKNSQISQKKNPLTLACGRTSCLHSLCYIRFPNCSHQSIQFEVASHTPGHRSKQSSASLQLKA